MIIKTKYSCSHCGKIAHEYEGLEGSIYIGVKTHRICEKSPDGDHNFIAVKRKKKSKHRIVTQGIAR